MEDDKNKKINKTSEIDEETTAQFDECSLNKVDYKINNSNTNLDSEEDKNAKKLVSKLSKIFTEYMLSEVQCLAAFKFIKDKVGDKNCKEVDNLRKWVLMKINNKPYPSNINKLQLGCPDLVPGITMKAWWDPNNFLWVQELMKNIDIIKDELSQLKENKGFQPYKSPSYANEKNKVKKKSK